MGGNSRWNGVLGVTNVVMAVATVGILVTAIAGLCLVERELNELQRQNRALENTMRQTYRPLGAASYSKDLASRTVDLVPHGGKPGKLSFHYNLLLSNRGKGVLSYIGCFSHVANDTLSFRAQVLAALLDTVVFDYAYSYARWTPIQPDHYLEVHVGSFLNIDFEQHYFVYTLFLYADQDGELYDTERLDAITFEGEPLSTPEGLRPKPESVRSYSTEKYHFYTADEKQALLDMIDRFDHPLADVIRAGY